MPTRPNREDYSNLNKYIRYINESFEPRQKLFIGSFYSYVYELTQEDKINIPYNKLKFYDLMPLTYFFDVHPKHPHLLRGINFHHLPINIRLLYLTKMKKITESAFNRDTRLLILNEYRILLNMYRKATRASIRNYDVSKIRDARKIPNSKIQETLNWYASTHYGIGIGMVESRYLRFV
jgi:hypothetical protein